MAARRGWLIGSAVLALALYALLWIGFVQRWQWVVGTDQVVIDALHGYGLHHPTWVTFWNVFCTVFGPTAFRLFALAVIVVALVRRNLRVALFLLITVELGGLVALAAKSAANRPRPAEAFVGAFSTSFPSGHAVGVMVGVLALWTVLLPLVVPRLRSLLVIVGAVLVFAVGAGRVVLNVHYPSDVIAGWALGYMWFVIGLLLVRPVAPIMAADEIPAAPGSSH